MHPPHRPLLGGVGVVDLGNRLFPTSGSQFIGTEKPGEKTAEIYAVSLKNPVPVKIRREQVLDNPPDGGQVGGRRFRGRGGFGFGRFGSQWSWDKNHQRLLITQNGEIFLYRLADKKIELVVKNKARELLAERGYDPVYGARPLKRVIQRDIQNPLAMKILAGEFREGETVLIEVSQDGEIVFKKK